MNKPKAYIQGWIEFYKLKFKVNEDVLIPRPETELLIDEVLNCIKYYVSGIKGNEEKDIVILDVGTGSGAIAISIAKNLSQNLTSGIKIKIIATDISEKALKVARQNAKFHAAEKQIIFIQSDLLKSKKFEPLICNADPLILVTNLPYIPSGRIPYLDSSVRDFEPYVALNGGENGFEIYEKFFSQINEKGWKPKLIVGEIDYTHGELAVNVAQKYFPDSNIEVKNDLAHKQRILIIK